ncbi:MAG: hypothetical protein QOG75_5965 [Mycobacterium sp.]|jgi:hypothetical protein|nr:hypothetical protein [Mycobacterium sp.]
MADDQDQREAAIEQRLVEAVQLVDIAGNVLQVSGADDVSLDQLSQADRIAYAATHASIARTHVAVALVQANVALTQQLQALTTTIAFGQAQSSGEWG